MQRDVSVEVSIFWRQNSILHAWSFTPNPSLSNVILLPIHPSFLILQVNGTLPAAAAEAKEISLERDAAEKERDKVITTAGLVQRF